MANLIGQQLGQYHVIALLGKGGMASVYRARQASVERDVAIKVMKPDLAETHEFGLRFKREAQTIAALSHPHILKVFDYGQHQDMVYLVMELLSGGSLADRIQQGPLPPEVAARILDQIASALDYAHRRGIVHRDLKPQNVLMDEEGNALLTDFGIAKLLTETTTLTRSGATMGTPSYMAPEQWRGEAVDARSDIYALGVMLYEMLAGEQPFRADTPFSIMHKHIFEAPPPIRSLRPDLKPGIDSVLEKALAKERAERYNSAGEMAGAFRAALRGEFLSPAPPPSPEAPRTSLTPHPLPPTISEYGPTPPWMETIHPAAEVAQRARPAWLGIGVLLLVLLAVMGVVLILLLARGQTPEAAQVAANVTDTALPPATATPGAILPPAATIPTETPPPTPLPGDTALPTSTPLPAPSDTPLPTITPSWTPSDTPTFTPSPTPTPTETPTLTPTPTETPDTQRTLEFLLPTYIAGTATELARVTGIALTAQALVASGLTQTATQWTPTPTDTATNTPIPPPSATFTPFPTPTVVPTSTPIPSPTPDPCPPTLQVGCRARVFVTDEGLKLREGPGPGYAIVENLPSGTIVTLLGAPKSGGGLVWWYVQSPVGNVGWSVQEADHIVTLLPLSSFIRCDQLPLRVGCLARVTVPDEGLKLRAAPRADARLLENLPNGTMIQLIGGPSHDGAKNWWYAQSPSGRVGWVAQEAGGVTYLVPGGDPGLG